MNSPVRLHEDTKAGMPVFSGVSRFLVAFADIGLVMECSL
jgi:hypothetical protein